MSGLCLTRQMKPLQAAVPRAQGHHSFPPQCPATQRVAEGASPESTKTLGSVRNGFLEGLDLEAPAGSSKQQNLQLPLVPLPQDLGRCKFYQGVNRVPQRSQGQPGSGSLVSWTGKKGSGSALLQKLKSRYLCGPARSAALLFLPGRRFIIVWIFKQILIVI